VTSGPLLNLDVSGRGPGEAIDARESLVIRASAASGSYFEKLELVANGEVIATAESTEGAHWTAALETPFSPAASGWIAARCLQVGGVFRSPGAAFSAHTSPVLVRVGGQAPPRQPTAADALRSPILSVRNWIEHADHFANPKARQHLLDLCDAALARLAGGP
jgi:hypothetical protein